VDFFDLAIAVRLPPLSAHHGNKGRRFDPAGNAYGNAVGAEPEHLARR
jgi:hypothetical protein